MVQAENVEKTTRQSVLGRSAACTERIEVLSNKIERNHPLRHSLSSLHPESCRDGIWRIFYEKVYMSPRPPPTISFKDNWMKELEFKSRWKQQRHPTNPTKIKNPIIKNGETRG